LEGVIKFQLDFSPAAPLSGEAIAEINAWRKVLFLLRLTGRDPERYDGLGYGNISCRVAPFSAPEKGRPFLVSGTQTGGIAVLGAEHYATVLECDIDHNRVVAEGPVRPSSEALTHGALYQIDPSLRWVMHVHSPEIWRNADRLGLPATRKDAAYGTPEMAGEVRRLMADDVVRRESIFAMGGHEDGLVAFGVSAEGAGTVLLRHLARAFQLQSGGNS